MFANSFVSSLVEGYVCYWVCLFVGWGYVCYWVCLFVGWCLCDNIISFNSRDGFLNYKWADYWPYWEFIYLFFSMWPSVVMCITMGYLFHVWGGVGVALFFFVLNCYVLGGEFEQLAA